MEFPHLDVEFVKVLSIGKRTGVHHYAEQRLFITMITIRNEPNVWNVPSFTKLSASVQILRSFRNRTSENNVCTNQNTRRLHSALATPSNLAPICRNVSLRLLLTVSIRPCPRMFLEVISHRGETDALQLRTQLHLCVLAARLTSHRVGFSPDR